MVSLFLGLSHKISPAGIIGFSGRLIVPDNFDKSSINFPICLVHGTDDDVVDHSSIKDAEQFLNKNNIENKILSIPNLAHTIDLSGIEFAKNFIKSKIIKK
jgi:phospholipase/carboxylesterase